MRSVDLIRTVDGIEMPTTGPWLIGRGQPVELSAVIGWRRRRSPARVVSGALTITPDPLCSTLELTVEALDHRARTTLDLDDRSAALVLSCRMIVVEDSMWWFVGNATLGDGVHSVVATSHYQGVFRHGEVATTWLRVTAHIERVATQSGRLRKSRTIRLTAELGAQLATRPPGGPDGHHNRRELSGRRTPITSTGAEHLELIDAVDGFSPDGPRRQP